MLDELKVAARRYGDDQAVRTLMADCRRLLSERGAADSVSIAAGFVRRYEALSTDARNAFFERLARDFSPDPQAVLAAAQAYAAAPGPEQLARLTHAAEPPRQELMRRINRAPGGTAALVHLRQSLLERLPGQPALRALEADLLHLLSSWFNPGFLEIRRVDWNSPAQLLEQLIRHEAVHQIDGWDDLRRRLQPDRRCFAFFHPQLPNEPLIFVEVALVPDMPDAIAPLIDKTSLPLPPSRFKVATFYSISNCQPGLRGVSLGNFLIKRVAEELKRELPQLRTFVTLSPIPGFAKWLAKQTDFADLPLRKPVRERAIEALANKDDEAALLRLGALYLLYQTPTPTGDPVARFHLDNGARLERLNARANLARTGQAQSHGLMVNYLYDLGKVEAHHAMFTQGEIAAARAVTGLL